MIAGGPPAAVEQPATGSVKQLNRATLFVRDVQKSVAFYLGLFGMPVVTGLKLNAERSFLGIYPAQGQATGTQSVCLEL